MNIQRLTQFIAVVGKDGKATREFSTLWDRICKILEGTVTPGSGYIAMTGTANDTTLRDTSSITTEQLAQRVKALEDRLASLNTGT